MAARATRKISPFERRPSHGDRCRAPPGGQEQQHDPAGVDSVYRVRSHPSSLPESSWVPQTARRDGAERRCGQRTGQSRRTRGIPPLEGACGGGRRGRGQEEPAPRPERHRRATPARQPGQQHPARTPEVESGTARAARPLRPMRVEQSVGPWWEIIDPAGYVPAPVHRTTPGAPAARPVHGAATISTAHATAATGSARPAAQIGESSTGRFYFGLVTASSFFCRRSSALGTSATSR